MLRLLVIAVLAALAAQSQSPQPEVPRAPVASQKQPQLIYPCTAIRTGEAEAAPVASYVDESIPVLKKQVPTLRSIRVDAAPDPTASILDHTGEVLADLLRRDERDSRRTAAPLMAAPDAHLLDTTHLGIDAAFRAAVDIIEAVRAGRKRR